ncbi:hypothetical protein HGRIS_005343 [Hohenbuehelia grisea]|uniref:Zn(2)-C6 fungal-type domain-containing protein n=1 Tax=Hohenbuehelia grisea TaxID=104357 RepID=A0ABR3JEP7_9AGAR
MAQGDQPEAVPKKPIRGKACGTCRRRKEKCDGTRPVCQACQLRKLKQPLTECTWERRTEYHYVTLIGELEVLNARLVRQNEDLLRENAWLRERAYPVSQRSESDRENHGLSQSYPATHGLLFPNQFTLDPIPRTSPALPIGSQFQNQPFGVPVPTGLTVPVQDLNTLHARSFSGAMDVGLPSPLALEPSPTYPAEYDPYTAFVAMPLSPAPFHVHNGNLLREDELYQFMSPETQVALTTPTGSPYPRRIESFPLMSEAPESGPYSAPAAPFHPNSSFSPLEYTGELSATSQQAVHPPEPSELATGSNAGLMLSVQEGWPSYNMTARQP